MTTSHHDPTPSSGDPAAAASDADRIAAELAALGEDPADDDELAFVSMAADDPDELVEPDVRTIATLVELSQWTPPTEGLLPLERHRVWRRVEQHVPAPVADPETPAANTSQGLRGLVAGLALVAGVVLLPRFDLPPAPTEDQRAATQSVGEAARSVLDALPGEQDATRARSLTDGYAARLEAARGDAP